MSSDDPVNLDEVIVTGLEPQTWYAFVQGQLELLRSHVQEREKQIDESVKAYEKGRRGTDVEQDDDRYPIVILEEYSGIEGPPSELREIFEYYYPNLQRRSMLIVLFSFFERQLDQLCQLFAKEHQLSITHVDLKGKGIDRARLYLQKVIGLPLTASVIWQEIKRIQRVRNVVVHNDAKVASDEKDLIEYVDKANELARLSTSFYESDIEEVDILEGYLLHVLETFDSYCGEVNKAICSVSPQVSSESQTNETH
jgi:hypothetical protein